MKVILEVCFFGLFDMVQVILVELCVMFLDEVLEIGGFGKGRSEEMDKMENVEKVEIVEDKVKWFLIFVLMVSIFFIGFLVWSIWFFIDLYKVDVLIVEKFGNLSFILFCVVVMMDVVWSVMMVVQYQGQKLVRKVLFCKSEYDFLLFIGWVEVLFVVVLLGYYGMKIGGGVVVFVVVFLVFMKLMWMMVLNGLKDFSDLIDEEKVQMVVKKWKLKFI